LQDTIFNLELSENDIVFLVPYSNDFKKELSDVEKQRYCAQQQKKGYLANVYALDSEAVKRLGNHPLNELQTPISECYLYTCPDRSAAVKYIRDGLKIKQLEQLILNNKPTEHAGAGLAADDPAFYIPQELHRIIRVLEGNSKIKSNKNYNGFFDSLNKALRLMALFEIPDVREYAEGLLLPYMLNHMTVATEVFLKFQSEEKGYKLQNPYKHSSNEAIINVMPNVSLVAQNALKEIKHYLVDIWPFIRLDQPGYKPNNTGQFASDINKFVALLENCHNNKKALPAGYIPSQLNTSYDVLWDLMHKMTQYFLSVQSEFEA